MQFSANKMGLLLLLVLATILLGIGLVAPIITFKKFIFIQNTFSILTACWNLLKEGQWFLFILIGLFSVVLPVVKLCILFRLILTNQTVSAFTQKLVEWIHLFGKWSMLDVFVVAILVVVVKLGAIGNVEKHIGLYAYAGAAVLIIFLVNKVIKQISENSAKI